MESDTLCKTAESLTHHCCDATKDKNKFSALTLWAVGLPLSLWQGLWVGLKLSVPISSVM